MLSGTIICAQMSRTNLWLYTLEAWAQSWTGDTGWFAQQMWGGLGKVVKDYPFQEIKHIAWGSMCLQGETQNMAIQVFTKVLMFSF